VKSHQKHIFILFLVLAGFLLLTCEKQKYDLFPLKVGNEFYYKYDKKEIGFITDGSETWKVQSEIVNGNSVTFTIERSLNGVFRSSDQSFIDSISNRRTYFEVIQDKSSVITFWGFSFKRFQSKSEIELNQVGDTRMPTITGIFSAFRGLTRYSSYHPPNHWSKENLYMDSLKLMPD
jgi:hypothetical protein